MKMIRGRKVYDTIAEIVDPKHTALLVIDIQNDHGPNGALARLGRDVSWAMRIVPRVKEVIAEARRRGMLVIFTCVTVSGDGRAESAPFLRFRSKVAHILGHDAFEVEDTWGNDVLDELERREDEPRIVKYRSSAFHGTRLDLILRNSGIESTVVVGLATEGCVDATAKDLLGYGYYPVMLRDCVTGSRPDLHEAALLIMSVRYDVITSDELFQAWNASDQVAGGAPSAAGG